MMQNNDDPDGWASEVGWQQIISASSLNCCIFFLRKIETEKQGDGQPCDGRYGWIMEMALLVMKNKLGRRKMSAHHEENRSERNYLLKLEEKSLKFVPEEF